MSPENLAAAKPKEISEKVEIQMSQEHPVLVLFESGLQDLNELFVDDFAKSRQLGNHILLFRGERLRSKDEFYDECVRLMPFARKYFGRNLDALSEVLRDRSIGLSQDPSRRTYWIWRNAHVLYLSQQDLFMKLFAGFVEIARNVSRAAPGYAQHAQSVAFLLTGQWEAMANDALDDQSFLHKTVWWQYRPQPLPEPTNLAVFRVSRPT